MDFYNIVIWNHLCCFLHQSSHFVHSLWADINIVIYNIKSVVNHFSSKNHLLLKLFFHKHIVWTCSAINIKLIFQWNLDPHSRQANTYPTNTPSCLCCHCKHERDKSRWRLIEGLYHQTHINTRARELLMGETNASSPHAPACRFGKKHTI